MPPNANLALQVDNNTRLVVGVSEIIFKSDKPFKSVEIKILGKDTVVQRKSRALESTQLETTLRVPEDILLSSQHTIRISHPQFLWKKTIDIGGKELLSAYRVDGPEKQIWRRVYDKVEVIIGLVNRAREAPDTPRGTSTRGSNPLSPTTDEILEICPKFRILVMGKSGAGKSSLINKAFGVTDAHVSHSRPGTADIDYEIVSEQNPLFLLHDSQGFEHGETDTLQIVWNFIKRRGEMTQIKRKLHAIWLCIEIPTAGGRVIETGVEEFLRLRVAGELGQVPVIVVFTKYDRLVNAAKLILSEGGQEATIEDVEERANELLKEQCFAPVEDLPGETIPYIRVSTRPQYAKTLADLIEITFDNVRKYIMEAGVVTGISQKVNPSVKIRTSIEIGKKNYWRGLASNTALPGVTLNDFLDVIHTDIVKVWDLDDKNKYLLSRQFKIAMLNSVEHTEKRNPNRILVGGLPMLGAIAGIVSALSGPAAPIVVPIAASVLLAVWAHEVYHKTHTNLRRIMTYILNLTLVMQNLFWIQNILATHSQQSGVPERVTVPIKRRFINLAYHIYFNADDRHNLLDQIDEYSKKVTFLFTGGPDATVEKIIELINASTIKDEDAFKQHDHIQAIDSSWENQEDELLNFPPVTP